MSKPGDDGPLMPAIRFVETMFLWGLVGLMLVVSGTLLTLWGMLQSPLALIWAGAMGLESWYVGSRLPEWWRETKRLREDLRRPR